MKIEIYKPKNKALQNYIECYYTLQRDYDDKDITYFGFPSNIKFLSLFQGAELKINKNDLIIENQANEEIRSILIIDNQKQGLTTYKGRTNEITIYFKTLGINAFLEKPLCNYITNIISEFNPYEDYNIALKEVFKIKDDAAKIQFLESYFVSKLNDFCHPFLNEALEIIASKNKTTISISELANSFSISRATLHKHFLQHIGTTPSQFIKIERFRNAINLFTKHAAKEQLIDIAYLAEYFDQSHMVKDFKTLTGYSPKIFFSKLSKIENIEINWVYL